MDLGKVDLYSTALLVFTDADVMLQVCHLQDLDVFAFFPIVMQVHMWVCACMDTCVQGTICMLAVDPGLDFFLCCTICFATSHSSSFCMVWFEFCWPLLDDLLSCTVNFL